MAQYGGTREPFVWDLKTQTEAKEYALAFHTQIPDVDVQLLRSVFSDQTVSDTKLKCSLALTRWTNRICDRWPECTREKVIACPVCHLTFYCSPTCMHFPDFQRHTTQRCQKNNLDFGPLAIAIAKTKN